MSETLIVNLFGGPGAGKSTTASGIFYKLKLAGVNCELVDEEAKHLTWEERCLALTTQPYVFGKQLMRLARVIGKVDVVVTDSPILLSAVYVTDKYPASFIKSCVEIFDGMNNLNFFLLRQKEYNPIGRNQTEEEAIALDKKIRRLLDKYCIRYYTETANEMAPTNILLHPKLQYHLTTCGYSI